MEKSPMVKVELPLYLRSILICLSLLLMFLVLNTGMWYSLNYHNPIIKEAYQKKKITIWWGCKTFYTRTFIVEICKWSWCEKNGVDTTLNLIEKNLIKHKVKLPQDVIDIKYKKYMTLFITWIWIDTTFISWKSTIQST
jgi:hypothetical protein